MSLLMVHRMMSDCKRLKWNNVCGSEEHGNNRAGGPAASLPVAAQGVTVLFSRTLECQKMHHLKKKETSSVSFQS